MHSHGAESMARLAVSMAVEASLMICAPIHDALLSEADLPDNAVPQTGRNRGRSRLDRVYEWHHALI